MEHFALGALCAISVVLLAAVAVLAVAVLKQRDRISEIDNKAARSFMAVSTEIADARNHLDAIDSDLAGIEEAVDSIAGDQRRTVH